MLTVGGLLADYRTGVTRPVNVVDELLSSIGACDQPVWISRVADDELRAAARALGDADPALPLYGVPIAVKDNIDVAGLPTTAALPTPVRVPDRSAPVVERLVAAGALVVGKTNMDQLATGLVGTRSPYGACHAAGSAEHVAGGSSSGSALAVALGHACLALGTDTAGSGRVPAACNGLVGLKPTRGLLSTRGVVPACASLDCVSVFAADVAGVAAALRVTAAPDATDPWSRTRPSAAGPPSLGRLGVPAPAALAFDEPEAQAAWRFAVDRAAASFELVEVDVTPLLDAAPLLYAAWVAERATDLIELVDVADPSGLDPTVAAIIRGGAARKATDVFAAQHRLAELRAAAAPTFDGVDALLLPTIPSHPTLAQVAADPVGVNERLGRYTNFVNLMDLCAVSVPGPPRSDGLPAGVTLLAPAFADERLLALAVAWTGVAPSTASADTSELELAVVGAHLSGLPLNRQLLERGARFLRAVTTAPVYRLYALPAEPGTLARPGLVRATEDGAAIEAEVWALSAEAVGTLLSTVSAPLGFGRVELADGTAPVGFLCEAAATVEARDVSAHGGWRAYLAASAVAT